MKRIVFVFMLFCLSVHPQTLADYEKNITEYTLSNGMHFIILEDHTAPVISFHIHMDTGSVDEKYGETGISHLIEHLAFNGTKKIGTKNWKEEKNLFEEMDRVYDEILKVSKNTSIPEGITLTPTLSPQKAKEEYLKELQERFKELKKKVATYEQPNEFGRILEMHGAVGPNAYTSNDMTAYWVELPSNKVELWALLESDRLFTPVFRGFYEELEVVKEERRMRVDNSPWGRLMEEFHNIAYKVHPYRNPVVGYPEDLLAMTRPEVKGFYERYYVPSNAVAVLVGDVEPKEIIPVIERYFGSVPKGRRDETFIPSEPPLDKTERKTVIKMDSEPIFLTGFHIPDVRHPDMPALEVLAEILAGGRTSRIYSEMVKEKKIALSTGAWCRTAKYPSIFYIWAVASKGHTNREMEEAVYRKIEEVKTDLIKQEEIEGAKARLRMWFLTEMDSRRGMAEQMAWYQSITGDWRNLFLYMEDIESVTAEDIKAVMEKYLIKENRVVGMIERKFTPDHLPQGARE
jgi:predicted Zn-dependent peptidase